MNDKVKLSDLIIGETYSFYGDSSKLTYIGKNWSGNGYWHQFEKENYQGVWCEMTDSDIKLLIKTP